MTPLIAAITSQNDEAVQLLLGFHADPNILSPRGDLPLFHAISNGNLAVIELLIHAGSRLVVDKISALHYAARLGAVAVAALLIGLGADRNRRNAAGQTPFDVAVRKGQKACELFLGSDPLPLHSNGIDFLVDVSQLIDQELRRATFDNPASVQKVFRRIVILDEVFVSARATLRDLIENLRKQGSPGLSPYLAEIAKTLTDQWDRRCQESREAQAKAEREVRTPEGIEAVKRWKDVTDRRIQFIHAAIKKYRRLPPADLEKLTNAEESFAIADRCMQSNAERRETFEQRILAADATDPIIAELQKGIGRQ